MTRRKASSRIDLRTRPRLTLTKILAWADDHHRRTGDWPTAWSGGFTDPATGAEEHWRNIHYALVRGHRSLRGGSSLAKLLAERGKKRHRLHLPRLTQALILAWADDHYQRTGTWPQKTSGNVLAAPAEKWLTLDDCLRRGRRGLRGGSSVAQLLKKRRGVRNIQDLAPLTARRILEWADAHRRRTGQWPTRSSGCVRGAPEETWSAVADALYSGHRGLPGDSSLAQLLEARRGVRNSRVVPRLTKRQILAWADAHHARTGRWPSAKSGPVHEDPAESWANINHALSRGRRGLLGGDSLALLLERHGRKKRRGRYGR
jgi:hypothetical protein